MGAEDRGEPVELSRERAWPGRGRVRSQQIADLPENCGDQCMVLDELVNHRGELGHGGAQRWQELTVLTSVMGVDRGAEAEAVAEQILADGVRGMAAGLFGDLLAERNKPLPQSLVNVNQLLAERSHAVGRSQREW